MRSALRNPATTTNLREHRRVKFGDFAKIRSLQTVAGFRDNLQHAGAADSPKRNDYFPLHRYI